MAPRPIIIDTDPGQDDAVAILLALASGEDVEVLGLTTVAGNVPLALTTANALKILELARRPDIPVIAGCSRPLLRPLVTAEHVHGRTGLDGPALPEPGLRPRAGHGVDFIVDTVMAAPEGAITLCALGPLTNVAAAIIKEPRLATRLEGIVIMGGGWSTGGNVTPAAEFNIHVDPHAAAVVLGSRARVTMIPLDCTHQVLTTAPRRERIRALGTPVAAAVCAILDTYDCYDFAKYGDGGAPLHDPCVIAQVIWPALFAGRRVSVEIETASELTMGMTVVDWWGVSGRAANADFIRTVDAEAFFDNLTARLARY